MKTKTMILLAVLSISAFTTRAQIGAGIKGGFNFASLTGFNGDSRVGAHAGLFLHHTINNRWCFQPEVLYSGEGQRYFSDVEQRTLALDYVQIPLMIQYFPVKQLYFEFGPQLGILASAQDKGGGTNYNVKDDFAPTQVGLNIGVGVKATYSLGFYGRYNFGLTDVSRFDNIVDHSYVGQLGMSIRLK
ncbi:MAG: PorT family protein [Bacteroidetes bacterium]|nr:MAG: PorT family protein [Bacteroidota bacterium]